MKTKIVKPFTTERKAEAFEQLRQQLETIYPGENVYLFGNLNFVTFDIDALLVTQMNAIFFEFKLNTVKQNVVTPHERHPWLFNDGTEVYPGNHESNPSAQMLRKRNLLYHRLHKNVQYIYGCVCFTSPCTVTNRKRHIGFFEVCDLSNVVDATRLLELTSTNKDWNRDAVLDYLITQPTATGYYLPEKKNLHRTPDTPAQAPAKTSFLVHWLKSIFSGAGRAAL